MNISGKNIGFALTGSFCTISKILPYMQEIVDRGANLFPIISYSVDKFDTRFGGADDLKKEISSITSNSIISTIVDAEPIGPKGFLDAVVVAPCTGNTIAKLANAVIDNSVTMACKAQLRNLKPVIIGVSTNDGLSGSAMNIANLLNRKHVYFIPFRQDNPIKKPNSIVADFSKMIETIELSLEEKQIQPILL